MGIDMNYEVYKYLSKQIEDYESLQEILDKNGVTFDEAKDKVVEFKKKFKKLCFENSIKTENFVPTTIMMPQNLKNIFHLITCT